MRAFAFRIEFLGLVPVDRLHHAHPGELHWTAILCRFSDAMRGGLNLFHLVFCLRHLFREPRNRLLQREQPPAPGSLIGLSKRRRHDINDIHHRGRLLIGISEVARFDEFRGLAFIDL
jgi:hypothetical protein